MFANSAEDTAVVGVDDRLMQAIADRAGASPAATRHPVSVDAASSATALRRATARSLEARRGGETVALAGIADAARRAQLRRTPPPPVAPAQALGL